MVSNFLTGDLLHHLMTVLLFSNLEIVAHEFEANISNHCLLLHCCPVATITVIII